VVSAQEVLMMVRMDAIELEEKLDHIKNQLVVRGQLITASEGIKKLALKLDDERLGRPISEIKKNG